MDNPNEPDIEAVVATLARLFAQKGMAAEVAVLAKAQPEFVSMGVDYWNNSDFYLYRLYLRIPVYLYSQLTEKVEKHKQKDLIEKHILNEIEPVLRPYEPEFCVRSIDILPQVQSGERWREKAEEWLTGKGINNQGRVRSDNIASLSSDGLLFRSDNEIFLYKALKARGISFAPLPVFVRGGESYRRIEPDFVIVKDGMLMIVEVDGDTVHHETPVEAHNRTTMLLHEGAKLERVKASECATQELANQCADKLLRIIEKHKSTR